MPRPSALPPAVLARTDQDHAALADLTRRANIHRRCTLPDACAVDDLTRHLMERFLARRITVRDLARLLAVAALDRSRRLSTAQILRLDVPAVPPATAGPLLSHVDTIAAIADLLEHGDPDPRDSALRAALTVHIAHPASGPDSECPNCEGSGLYFDPDAGRNMHCHCGCPWCAGCDTPVCDGPCETVEAIADALHIGASRG